LPASDTSAVVGERHAGGDDLASSVDHAADLPSGISSFLVVSRVITSSCALDVPYERDKVIAQALGEAFKTARRGTVK
jgi:hypothetical protein